MSDFLHFMDSLSKRMAFHMEITYNKTCDWCIYVYLRGLKNDYPDCEYDDQDVIVCDVEDGDMQLCFAMAHVTVKNWLMEHCGGY